MIHLRPTTWLLIYTALLGAVAFAWREAGLLPDDKLRLYVLDVGQGDSILLVSPHGHQILVDGGPDLSALEQLGKHMPFFDRTLDLVVLTHPDSDHITALPEVLRRYRVRQIMLTGVEHDTGRYQDVIDETDRQDIPVIVPDPAKDILFDDGLVLDVIWPDAATMDPGIQTNRSSIVLRAIYGQDSILLTGDIDEWTENRILEAGVDINSDILKIAHHGSKTSSSTGFLLAVSPELALVSAGEDNSYGHPSPVILNRLHTLHVPHWSTTGSGTIMMEFNGKTP